MTSYADILTLIPSSGPKVVDLADNAASITLVQANALAAQGVTFSGSDAVVIKDSATAIEALTVAQIATLKTLGASQVLATDRALILNVSQVIAFADGNLATYARYDTQHGVTSSDIPVGLAASGVKAGEVMVSLNDGSYVVAHRTEVNQTDSYISSQKFDVGGNPVGTSTIISEATLYAEAQLAVSSLADGGYILAWTHRQRDVYTQRYDADGVAVGEPAQITTSLGNMAPNVIGLSDGGYVVTSYQSTNAGGELLSLRYDASGVLISRTTNSPSVISSAYLEGGKLTEMVELTDGKVMMIWPGSDGSGGGVMGQIIDSTGTIGSSFFINTTTLGFQGRQSVTALADGGFVVVWLNASQDYTISLQRFNDVGGKVGSEVTVNSSSTPQSGQQVTALAGGGFVVTWAWDGQDSPSPASGEWGGVYAQLFDAHGNKVGSATVVNTTVIGGQDTPKTVALEDGGYVVAWQENIAANGDGIEINAQVFDADGNKVGGELAVNVSESGNQSAQTVIALPGGGFAITWYDEQSRKYLTRAFINDTEKAILSDTAFATSSLKTSDVAALAKIGIDEITISDGGHVTLVKAVAAALITMSGLEIVAAGSVTIAGTGAALDDFSVADIAKLKALGVTGLDASDNVLSLSLDQANAYAGAGIALAASDVLTVRLSSPELAVLSASDLSVLGAIGVDVLDLTGNAASLSLARITEIRNAGFAFVAADVITLADSQFHVGELTASEVASLGAWGVDKIDLTEGSSGAPLILNLDQAATFLAAGIIFTADSKVHVSGSISEIAALDATDIAAFASLGVDTVLASGTLPVSVAQFKAYCDYGIVIDAGIEDVQLVDSGANLETISTVRIAQLVNFHIRLLNAIDDSLALTMDQIYALRAVGASIHTSDVLTLSVTSAKLSSLSSSDFSTAVSFGTTLIEASTALDASLATLSRIKIAGLAFATDFTARLSDTAANLLAASIADVTAYTALGIDVVRVADSASVISGLSAASIAALDARGVSEIDVTNGAVSLTLTQASMFATSKIVFSDADTVSVTASSAMLANLNALDLAGLKFIDVDKIDASENTLTLTLAAAQSYLGAGIDFTAADAVTMKLTYDQARDFSKARGDSLHASGVDRIEIDMTSAQLKALTFNQLKAFLATGIDGITGLKTFTFPDLTYDLVARKTNYNPVITSNGGGASGAIAISENKTVITTVKATDAEAGHLAYAIVGGIDKALFTIDSRTGALVFKTAPNFEKPLDSGKNNVYDLVIQVSDGALTDTQSLQVTVKNTDETPSVPTLTATNVNENAAIGTLVGTFSASDPEGKALTYKLLDTADGLFKLSGGKLVTAKTIDFEKVQRDTVTIEVSDGVNKATKVFAITVIDGLETFTGTSMNDTLKGSIGKDKILGLAGEDTLDGAGGNDVLIGGDGADHLLGGAGLDDLYGGGGRDRFVFKAVSELGTLATATDTIFDFLQKDKDVIDLTAIDANVRKSGNQGFTFIATDKFSKTAGELRYEKTKADTFVYGDVNGDGKADFVLHLDASVVLKVGDFLL